MEDYQKEISKILGSSATSLKSKGPCQTCNKAPGYERVVKGVAAGVHCRPCWARQARLTGDSNGQED